MAKTPVRSSVVRNEEPEGGWQGHSYPMLFDIKDPQERRNVYLHLRDGRTMLGSVAPDGLRLYGAAVHSEPFGLSEVAAWSYVVRDGELGGEEIVEQVDPEEHEWE